MPRGIPFFSRFQITAETSFRSSGATVSRSIIDATTTTSYGRRIPAWTRDQFRWITVGAKSQPGVGIVLTNYLNGSPADQDAVAGLIAKGALNGVHFNSDDLDGTFEKLRASDAEIVQEPTDQPWGTRDLAVRDPAGNLVRIDQPPAA